MKTTSFRYRSGMYLLAFISLILLILFLAAYGKYTDKKEELERVSLYVYELEVETPLGVILHYIGARPVEQVDWNRPGLQDELTSLVTNLDEGLINIDNPVMEVIPEHTRSQMRSVQDIIQDIGHDISGDSIDDETKEKIAKLTNAVQSCDVIGINRSWDQVNSELECLVSYY